MTVALTAPLQTKVKLGAAKVLYAVLLAGNIEAVNNSRFSRPDNGLQTRIQARY